MTKDKPTFSLVQQLPNNFSHISMQNSETTITENIQLPCNNCSLSIKKYRYACVECKISFPKKWKYLRHRKSQSCLSFETKCAFFSKDGCNGAITNESTLQISETMLNAINSIMHVDENTNQDASPSEETDLPSCCTRTSSVETELQDRTKLNAEAIQKNCEEMLHGVNISRLPQDASGAFRLYDNQEYILPDPDPTQLTKPKEEPPDTYEQEDSKLNISMVFP